MRKIAVKEKKKTTRDLAIANSNLGGIRGVFEALK